MMGPTGSWWEGVRGSHRVGEEVGGVVETSRPWSRLGDDVNASIFFDGGALSFNNFLISTRVAHSIFVYSRAKNFLPMRVITRG